MGKCLAYTVGAITFMCIGALVTGLTLYFVYPNMVQSNNKSDLLPRKALCDVLASDGSTAVSGRLTFQQTEQDEEVNITGTIVGLGAGLHGFHIHQYGVDRADCASTGSHYNPEDNPHGGPDSDFRHVGDLGNIESFATNGQLQAPVEIEDSIVSLYGDYSVVGRAIVIHAGRDDLGNSSDPSGAAGGRVACCTIFLTDEK